MIGYALIFLVTILYGSSCFSQSDPVIDYSKVFANIPDFVSDQLSFVSNNSSSQKIKITGRVWEADGKTPAADVILFFFSGSYSHLKGFIEKNLDSYSQQEGSFGFINTNSKGEYTLITNRPSSNIKDNLPGEIHVVVKSSRQKSAYHLGAITFSDDTLANESYWYKQEVAGHPRYGGIEVKRKGNSVIGSKDFVLYAQFDKMSLNSGLLKGENCPAFSPKHASGADKGSTACPMCKYGYKQGAMIWVNSDDVKAITDIAIYLDKRIAEEAFDKIRVFIIYMNPKNLSLQGVDAKLKAIAKENDLKYVALLYISSPTDKNATLYRLNPNPGVKNTVFVYQKRSVFEKFINMEPTTLNLNRVYNLIKEAHKTNDIL